MSNTTTSQSTVDLQAARSQASFSSDAINHLLNEGSRDTTMRRAVAKIIAEDPAFDKSKRPYMSRAERLESGLAVMNRLFEQVDLHDWDYMEYLEALFATDEALGVYLHEVAFQPVIQAQCSDEQQATWLPKCYNHEILGCYMQTELGHGSNVQRLETISTYDPKTEEFILHSPTITATKWWIGGLGIMATHGVVQARLFINEKDLGPHLFICQLRSLKDHSLMPGIQAGEIGPKIHGAMSAVDNGWARFNQVRIPRDQMLARFASVSPSGEYKKPPHDKLSYGGMIFIRAQMIGNLGWSLAKSVTISTRYLHIRRQFADPDAKRGDPNFEKERQVITYPGVYMRVLPQVAKAYVFVTIGKDMSNLYNEMSSQLASGNTTLLAETHAVSSGLKSYVSASVVEGSELVRRAMGGHGFMDAAGVGRIFARELPSTTYEGDNYILNLQVARAALKTLGTLRRDPKSTLSPSSAYFSSLLDGPTLPVPFSGGAQSWLSSKLQLELISLRASFLVERLERLLKSGKKFQDLSWECVNVSRAIVEAFLVRRMIEAVENTEEGLLAKGISEKEKKVLATLIQFYVLHTIETALPDLLEFGIIAPTGSSHPDPLNGPIESLRAQIDVLAKRLLPEAVGLTDAFNFSDYELDTALGNYDGKAYENLLERAKKNMDANAGTDEERKRMYEKHIKPVLKRGQRMSSL